MATTDAGEDSSAVGEHHITPWDPSPLLSPDLKAIRPDNVMWLVPDRIDENGRALYREDNAGLIKTARAAGIPIEYAYPREARAYLGEHGAIEVLTEISVIAGDGVIGHAASWLCLLVYKKVKTLLGNGSEAEVKNSLVTVRIAEVQHTRDSTSVRGFEFTGSVDALETTLDQLLASGRLASEPAAPTDNEDKTP